MIPIKTNKEIKIIAEGGKILAEIMEELKKKVQPEVTTKELNRVAETLIFKYKATSAFKDYDGFPSSLCTSVNNVIVHSVPSDYKLKQSDIISLDLGIKYKGFFTDMAITMPVGEVSPEILRFIRITKKSLKMGIKKARQGNTFNDIGNTIQRYIESQGFNVVRTLCGHGIGKELHEEPQIFNFGKRHTGFKIKQGMVFCIEPMVTMGEYDLKKSKDGFGFETKDDSLSCHFEHTVVAEEKSAKVLTELK